MAVGLLGVGEFVLAEQVDRGQDVEERVLMAMSSSLHGAASGDLSPKSAGQIAGHARPKRRLSDRVDGILDHAGDASAWDHAESVTVSALMTTPWLNEIAVTPTLNSPRRTSR